MAFDPFADAGIRSSLTFEKELEEVKSDSLSSTTTAGRE